jgi:hypothetical protein
MTVVVLGFPLGPVWARAVRSRLTVASRGVPGLVMLSTAGPAVLRPSPARRVTTATPGPEDAAPELPVLWLPVVWLPVLWLAVLWLPGDAITAMPPPRLN